MYSIDEPKNLVETAYLQKGSIGNSEIKEIPIVNFSLAIYDGESIVSGIVEIRHDIDKPSIKLNVVGTVRSVTYKNICKIIDLEGEYIVSLSNSITGSFSQRFSAHIDISKGGNGTGSFTFGNQSIHNAPVTS